MSKKKYYRAAFCLSCVLFFLGLPILAYANGPVIFVHGYGGKKSQWDSMMQDFQSNGYSAESLYQFSYNSLLQSNRDSAKELRDYVDWVRSRHDWQQVSIVAHSNGGLVTRWYQARLGGDQAVRRFVSIGTPHNGTSWAYGCVSPACFEMRRNSSFLQELNGQGCDRALWSGCDAIIIPTNSAQCGVSVQTSCLGHNQMLWTSSVHNRARELLQ
ncbi:hypothetical protein CAI21_19565 [Alkalilimnicola ehrlichii]|uniref:Lipase n=1 Tax=Alkalilimnicola ehrlichii TaxID=351052 RepID=A0A3E0WK21_9GAMM|nr:alpha/beta fold hydrolase [Alkalilimnicola ehrlichii]RFA25312.1 hypothetical protein CAI21_19565 [Alkalilimnicola ehrlichii]RFA32427.1 hypothetical protein CAL65_19775 [Alkalilimnicola ehrlichii]